MVKISDKIEIENVLFINKSVSNLLSPTLIADLYFPPFLMTMKLCLQPSFLVLFLVRFYCSSSM